jgi:transcriptional regulator with XRE-family HTH domain
VREWHDRGERGPTFASLHCVANGPDPLDFVKRVARRIASARREAGLTQEQLADLLRVTPRHVQRVEAGANVSLYALARIAGALGLDPSKLTEPEPDDGTMDTSSLKKARPQRLPAKRHTSRKRSKR